jgi:hypothetical protein
MVPLDLFDFILPKKFSMFSVVWTSITDLADYDFN